MALASVTPAFMSRASSVEPMPGISRTEWVRLFPAGFFPSVFFCLLGGCLLCGAAGFPGLASSEPPRGCRFGP